MLEAKRFQCRVSIDYLLRLMCLCLEVRLCSIIFRLCLFRAQLLKCTVNPLFESEAALPGLLFDDSRCGVTRSRLPPKKLAQLPYLNAIGLHVDNA